MLTKDELKFLEENSVKVTYKKGEILCKQGVMVSTVMYIEKGPNINFAKIISDIKVISTESI